MGLFNQIVAASSRDYSDVLHTVEHGKFSDRCSIPPEFIGVNDVWHVIMHEKSFEKSLRCLGIPPLLKEKIEHCARVVDGSPVAKRRHRRCSG